ncbi:MAG: bifunctional [glutamate--ammonia ligase]-adenylyl-L-tyrosine phosphorylase/[glutamate--ammonia-ligase] adenylyltransferase [Nitrospirota bacterium]
MFLEYIRDYGFKNIQRAEKNIESLNNEIRDKALTISLIEQISKTPDPDIALNNLERLTSCHPRKDKLHGIFTDITSTQNLLTLFSSSQFLSNFILTSPEELLDWILKSETLSSAGEKRSFTRELSSLRREDTAIDGLIPILRRFKNKQILRIGLRDLTGKADFTETAEELSSLAEVIVQSAYAICDRELKKKYGTPSNPAFAIIAMGKLGGTELNFSSDIDLMYIYSETKGETTGHIRISNHEYFTKLAELITKVLSTATEDGFAYRVDLRLRPAGSRGDIAASIDSSELYYESWGQTWERIALLRARPIAGDECLGREFMNRITPFIYRKYLDFSAIEEIRALKSRIDRSVMLKGRGDRDVKRGYGGIREIEFFIQTLQLIYGAREESIQERSTLKALHKLSLKGLLSHEEHLTLSKAYVFFRTVEHRLQIADGRQIHTIPAQIEDIEKLAKRIGYRDESNQKESEAMMEDYYRHTEAVHRIYDNLFQQYKIEPDTEKSNIRSLLEGEISEKRAVGILTGYGFHEPMKAYRNLISIREGEAMSHRTPRFWRILRDIMPYIFEKIISLPDPDLALNHLESFFNSVQQIESFLTLIKEDIRVIDILLNLFGNSEYLSRIAIGHPEIVESLITIEKKRSRSGMLKELSDAVSGCRTSGEMMDAIRRFKYLYEIKIGLEDLVKDAGFIKISHELTRLADTCLTVSLELSERELKERFGVPIGDDSLPAGIAIIGLGKLGGAELTYSSDLDILFVYSRDGQTDKGMSNHEYFSKLAERVCYILSAYTKEGSAFKIDTRLRPTGSKGPIAQSLDRFRHYYISESELWERQALIKSRFIAGDVALGRDFLDVAHTTVYLEPLQDNSAQRIMEMKKRMESELSREDTETIDLKFAPGGIVDIEFLIQYLQLRYGKMHRLLRVPNTFLAFKRIYNKEIITCEEYEIISSAYMFLRIVESRLRLLKSQSSSLLSRDQQKLTSFAKRMGFNSSMQFIEQLENHREKVKVIFERIFCNPQKVK